MKIEFEITIDDRLAALCRKLFAAKTAVFLFSVIIFTAGLFLFSEQIAKPYTFESDTVISSSEVNENFNALYTLINEHDNSITSLQQGGDGFWAGNSSTISYMGNVGIGITSPLTKTHITGSQISSFTGATGGILRIDGNYNEGSFEAIDFSYDTAFENPTARIAAYHDSSGSKLYFGTSNSVQTGITNEAMVIDHYGNVGIGTTSPDEKFVVNGVIKSTTGGIKFPDNTVQTTKAGGLVIKKGRTLLAGPLSLHQATPTYNYQIPVELPENTKGIFVALAYSHGGGADHGYLNFWAYQQNATETEDKTVFTNAHYNDYYNTDYCELLVPWNNTGSGNVLTVQVTSSVCTNSNNQYYIYYAGYLAGD